MTGNTTGLKASQIKLIERLGGKRCPAERVISPEIARAMTEISREVGRQIGLLIDRRGKVRHVILGDPRSVFLPEIPRRGRARLCGLRLVHTHLHHEPLNDDDFTDLALLRLDYIAAIEVLDTGLPGMVEMAHLLPANDADTPWTVLPKRPVHDIPEDFLAQIEALEDEFARDRDGRTLDDGMDRAVLIHVSKAPHAVAQDSLDELKELARSAGTKVVHVVSQRRDIDPKFVSGKGKMQQTVIKAMQTGAETLIFDLDLSPSQVKALSELTDLKILDRTQLILDIFAQHAVTREGKLQVELAQLKYLLPLLSMRQTALSRLTGGIGGRGPGETRLEIDRRRARDRVAGLEREVKKLGKRRELRRGVRTRKGVPTVAVVGYTNAGKSTLLNTLTRSEVTAENALFATLNPVSRRLRFPEDREIIITDTVGFIRNLPKDLMAAFRTTFEELHEADLLLHVMDSSSPDLEEKHDVVSSLLTDLELNEKPTIHVLNKEDRCDPDTLSGLVDRYDGVAISALDRDSLGGLIRRMGEALWRPSTEPAGVKE